MLDAPAWLAAPGLVLLPQYTAYVLLHPSVNCPIRPTPLLLPEQESVDRDAGLGLPVQAMVEVDDELLGVVVVIVVVVVGLTATPPVAVAVLAPACEIEAEEVLWNRITRVSMLRETARHDSTYT